MTKHALTTSLACIGLAVGLGAAHERLTAKEPERFVRWLVAGGG